MTCFLHSRQHVALLPVTSLFLSVLFGQHDVIISFLCTIRPVCVLAKPIMLSVCVCVCVCACACALVCVHLFIVVFVCGLQVRASGQQAASKDILRFAPLFEDEMTLDNLSRAQLQAVCKMLLLPTVGPDPLLRFHLRMKMRRLEADDQVCANLFCGGDVLCATKESFV